MKVLFFVFLTVFMYFHGSNCLVQEIEVPWNLLVQVKQVKILDSRTSSIAIVWF